MLLPLFTSFLSSYDALCFSKFSNDRFKIIFCRAPVFGFSSSSKSGHFGRMMKSTEVLNSKQINEKSSEEDGSFAIFCFVEGIEHFIVLR